MASRVSLVVRRRAAWRLLLGAAVVTTTVVVVAVLRGPDPCTPFLCDGFHLMVRLPFQAGGPRGLQALVLFGGLLTGALIMASVSEAIMGWTVALAVIAALALGTILTGSSSLVGPWYGRDGRTLPDGNGRQRTFAMDVEGGPSHCGLSSIVFLSVAWPPGRIVTWPRMSGSIREYVGNPNGNYPANALVTTFDSSATLPPDARYTGLHRGTWELWVSPTDATKAVYLKSGVTVERWPRETVGVGCA